MDEKYTKLLTKPIRNDRELLQDLLPLDQPLRIFIDPCDICNFRCGFCFQNHGEFKGSMMEEELFDTIVSQLKEFEKPINVIHLYGLGEPMLNEKVPLYLAKLKNAHVAGEVQMTSNGSRLTEKLSEQLVEAGLNWLTISLNGLSDQQFREIAGVKVDFEKFYSQIRYFYKIRGNCHLHIKINGECFSEQEQEKFVELFGDCSDTLNITHVVNLWSGINLSEGDATMYNTPAVQAENDQRPAVCPQIFYELMIHSNGDVSPCNPDYTYLTENLGNVKKTTVKQLWHGEKILRLQRQSLLGEEMDYKICKNCTYPVCASTVNITPFRDELLKRF